jgi:hypothetical protein
MGFSGARPNAESGLGGIAPAPLFTLEKSEELLFSVDTSECELRRIGEWDYVKVSDLDDAAAPGEPQLPMETLVLKLPLDAEVSSVQIVSGHYVEILNELSIAPAPEPVRWGDGLLHERVPDEDVSSLYSYFPGDALSYGGGQG